MDVIIKETGERISFQMIDVDTGQNDIEDFLGNMDVLVMDDRKVSDCDLLFVWSAEDEAYICPQETFDYFEKIRDDYSDFSNRLAEAEEEFGEKEFEFVFTLIDFYDDVENGIKLYNQALDKRINQIKNIRRLKGGK